MTINDSHLGASDCRSFHTIVHSNGRDVLSNELRPGEMGRKMSCSLGGSSRSKTHSQNRLIMQLFPTSASPNEMIFILGSSAAIRYSLIQIQSNPR